MSNYLSEPDAHGYWWVLQGNSWNFVHYYKRWDTCQLLWSPANLRAQQLSEYNQPNFEWYRAVLPEDTSTYMHGPAIAQIPRSRLIDIPTIQPERGDYGGTGSTPTLQADDQ